MGNIIATTAVTGAAAIFGVLDVWMGVGLIKAAQSQFLAWISGIICIAGGVCCFLLMCLNLLCLVG